MDNPVTQMAAISAAMRMLLAGNLRAKPDDLLIAASNGLTAPIVEMMMAHAANKRSTFLILFHVEGDRALTEKVIIVDASTKKGEINIGGGKFILKSDGKFAISSMNREEPYEYRFDRSGRRLVRHKVRGDCNPAVMELRGLQALIAKAATFECQREAIQLSVNCC